jgi:hypothetical protein
MTHIYRETDPVSGRWTGNSSGSDLSPFQQDQNWYEVLSAIATINAGLGFTVSIAYITQTASTFTFHMTDHTLQGPFVIPQSTFHSPGDGIWHPLTPYSVNDTCSINGVLYLVIFAHTSAATFSAGANDGLGHDYYLPMLSVPGNSLPTGGAVNMYLKKTDGHDFDVTWGYPVPVGGTTGQVLSKINGTDFNMHWSTAGATSMEGLSDFSYSSPHSVGQVVTWTGSAWQNATLAVTFAEISDIALTSPHSVGDVLTWNGSNWQNEQPSSVTTLYTLTDVNVTEGSGIDGYFLKWDNATSKWVAAASSSSLSGLTDVTVTEGSGISNFPLYWNNGASKWEAKALTSTSGIQKGDGSGWLTAASAGTDYLAPAAIGATVQAFDAQLFSNIPQNSKSAAYTTILTDGEKHILHPSADTTARTFTIDSNANVAYPIGTAITFVNQNAGGVVSIAITSDTMRLAGAGTTGSRTLAANGIATALKIATTEWIISGTGLT